MSVTNLYHVSAIEAGSTVIGAVSDVGLPIDTQVIKDPTSGDPYPRWISIEGQDARCEVSTFKLKTALSTIPVSGLDITTLTGRLKVYANKAKRGGTRETGAAHKRFTINDGLLYLMSLAIPDRGSSALRFGALAAYDGTNEPIVPTANVSLPSMVDDERWGLGPVVLNGVTVAGLSQVDVDFGVGAVNEKRDSDVWGRFPYIKDHLASLTLRGVDIDLLDAAKIPFGGKRLLHANSTIFIKKRKVGETFEANGSTVHIKLTVNGMAFIANPMQGASQNPAESTLRLELDYDGTNHPIKVTLDQAIA